MAGAGSAVADIYHAFEQLEGVVEFDTVLQTAFKTEGQQTALCTLGVFLGILVVFV